MKGIKPGKYRHYKGKFYEVSGVAKHSESGEKMVVYKTLYNCPDLAEEYGMRPTFVRPHKMFTEKINGQPRFEYVGDTK